MDGEIVLELSRLTRFPVPIWTNGPTECLVEFKKAPGKLPDGSGPDHWYHIHVHGVYWGSITSKDAARIHKVHIRHSLCTPRAVNARIVEVTRLVFATTARAE
jgi:hypothetical protein